MTDRERMLADLLKTVRSYTDGGLEGLLLRQIYVCRLCGARAVRRSSGTDADGTPFVRVRCSMREATGCRFVRKWPDPDPDHKKKRVPIH